MSQFEILWQMYRYGLDTLTPGPLTPAPLPAGEGGSGYSLSLRERARVREILKLRHDQALRRIENFPFAWYKLRVYLRHRPLMLRRHKIISSIIA